MGGISVEGEIDVRDEPYKNLTNTELRSLIELRVKGIGHFTNYDIMLVDIDLPTYSQRAYEFLDSLSEAVLCLTARFDRLDADRKRRRAKLES